MTGKQIKQYNSKEYVSRKRPEAAAQYDDEKEFSESIHTDSESVDLNKIDDDSFLALNNPNRAFGDEYQRGIVEDEDGDFSRVEESSDDSSELEQKAIEQFL